VRRRLAAGLNAYNGLIGYEVRDFEVGKPCKEAFCHFLKRFTGTMTSRTRVDMWVRATVGLRKIIGQWVIVHEQYVRAVRSRPSGVARLDLEPVIRRAAGVTWWVVSGGFSTPREEGRK
jgi:hypothetical protein